MSNYDESPSVYSGHLELEVLIDRPVSEVWTQYLDHASWITSHGIEYVQGEPGTLGSITRVSSKKAIELGLPEPRYHYCKVIALVPECLSVLKAYTEKRGAYGMHFIAFDEMRFTTVGGGQTKAAFNAFIEMRSEAIEKDPGAASLENSREGMRKNLENLKRIVESR